MDNLGGLFKALVGTDKPTAKNLEYAKVISVDKDNLECKVQLLVNDLTLDEVALSVNSNASSVAFPKVGSVVVIGWVDEFNAVVVGISVIDKKIEGSETQTLKALLDDFTDKQKTFASDLISAIKNATYTSPSGPTSPTPINVVEFETALNNYNQAVQTFLNGLSELYEK